MPIRSRRPSSLHALIVLAGVIGIVFAVPWLVRASRSSPAAAAPLAPVHPMAAGMPMSEDAMRSEIDAHFAAHPPHSAVALAPPADSFLISNYIFQKDGSVATQIDTAHITQGQSIRFKWVAGLHTATSGAGSSDPDAGLLFDRPMTSTASNFDFEFDNTGTFPFFCQIHEFLNMKGVVVVSAPTPARSQSWGGLKATYRP
ncbi:MAG: hypothetical protein HYR73_00630 [Candidatus Eisenbacteria bacterium]|nr:hypothetical protein [Candidatus Eisenbacteria bacterium]